MVLRVIKLKIRTLEELKLPPVLHDITLSLRGMTLLTGTTGSGKSTTLAAMVDLINNSYRCKIITIEDPVEYVHTNQKAMISQLELGQDTPSFEHGLRQRCGRIPDVILVGELRDSETMRMALRAADTGHQVFATVHSTNAAQTIERILAMMPPEERTIATSQLALSLAAIISQRLAVTREGNRCAAMEILRGGPVTSKFILENKLGELSDYIGTPRAGMQRFDQHLLDLYHQKFISGTEAMRLATNPEAVALGMREIHVESWRPSWESKPMATSRTRLAIGSKLLEARRPATARVRFTEKIVEIDPTVAQAWFLLGAMSQLQEHVDLAVTATSRPSRSSRTMSRPSTIWRSHCTRKERFPRRSSACSGLAVKPDYADAHAISAMRFKKKAGSIRPWPVIASARALIQPLRRPQQPGNLLRSQGKLAESVASYEEPGMEADHPQVRLAGPCAGCRWVTSSGDGPSTNGGFKCPVFDSSFPPAHRDGSRSGGDDSAVRRPRPR